MAQVPKSIVVLIMTTLCMALLLGRPIGPTAEAQARQAEQIDKQPQDVCVLVEAFVVEVNLSELYKQGVNPIGQKPNSVSVENILNCLKAKDIAQVTTGVKVTVNSGQHGEAKIKETIRIKQQLNFPSDRKVPVNIRYANYDVGKTLSAMVSVGPGGEILASFDFKENTFRNINSTDDTPPSTINREWSGAINLHAGKPAIAGATQNEETAVFLILCADIIDM